MILKESSITRDWVCNALAILGSSLCSCTDFGCMSSSIANFAQMTSEDTINVVPGVELKSEWDDPTYFTSAMSPIFPYGSGKHLNSRRHKRIPLHKWVSLLLSHCSR